MTPENRLLAAPPSRAAGNGLRIPLSRLCLAGRELDYIRRATANGHIAGDGEFTRRCHSLLERELGVPKALLTTSCTHALEMAAILLDIRPGDEVLVPSFTFVSTVNAFVLRGARPVFADIRPDTLNIDERKLEPLVTPRTRAIVVVHYAGVGCEMEAIMDLAGRHGLAVVEDNAHGLFGTYRGRPLGTFGCLATQSFHETKHITCGEGGALFVNDPGFIPRAEIIREKGTDRSRFFRGEVDRYGWVDIGSSYLPSEILAAFLLAQLETRESIMQTRRRLWDRYAELLRDWAGIGGVELPSVPEHCGQAHQIFYLLLPTFAAREALTSHLKARGIGAAFHYLPLHLSLAGSGLGGRRGDCPVTENVSDRLLRLPFYTDLSAGEQDEVVEALLEFEA